jgi:predicted AAA+ superfamily ATPase
MKTLATVFGKLGTRTNALLRRTWGFTLSLNNLVTYSPVAWSDKGLDQVPFTRAMLRLETELAAVSKALADAQENPSTCTLEQLYGRVEPAFRVALDERQVPTDAISLYMEQQQVLLFTYTGRTTRVVPSAFRDIFLRQLATHTFSTHPFLARESVENTGGELKAYARDFLRSLQRMYETDVEGIFREYRDLLLDLHQALCKQALRVPTYEGLPSRRIPALNGGVDSKFIGEMRAMQELEGSRRKQVLRLRDADDPVEKNLYRRLAASRDWGHEVRHVVTFLHERNQDPLARFKVFEAGLRGELEPVEIADAKSEQVIDQENNVARLRTLLTAFVKGSHMPFTLLEGEGGVGKTLSLQALVREIEGLKLVLIPSDYLGQIRQYAQKMAEQPWRTVLYIDDMTFDPRHYESFKVGTQGMKRFYENVTVMASANPSSLTHLPPEVLRRWPIRIKYGRPDLTKVAILRRVLRANCERVGMSFDPKLASEFRKLHAGKLKNAVPSAVHDFLQEVKLAQGK